MPRTSEYDSKARFHAPAFDYNIIQIDELTRTIKKIYGDILLDTNVRYDPPDSLYTKYLFEKDGWRYTAIVKWEAKTDYDLVRIASNVWNFRLHRSDWRGGETLEEKSQVMTAHILKSLGDYLA